VVGGELTGTGGVGDYELGTTIREGWGGTIREGRYRRTGRRVTVQEVRRDLTATPGLLERLGGIGREAATVRDRHLLAVYDLVDADGAFSLIAEWCDGATVGARLARGPLPPAQAVTVVHDVLAGLEALHARGLFHGQVGPETVVVDGEGTARLAELALCAAAAPAGFGAHSDIRDTARLGLHLLRKAGSRFDAVRRVLDDAAGDGVATDAARLRANLEAAASTALGPGWREGGGDPSRPREGRRVRLLLLLALAAVVAAAVAAVVLLAGRGGGASPIGPLTLGADAKLTVSPASGGCNTTFAFVAGGSLSGTGTLVYRWEQSDGQVTADTSLPIKSDDGAFRLTQAWRLQGSQKVDGTMTLHVLKPAGRRLTQTFHYNCP
jgi:hypothetical protein